MNVPALPLGGSR